MKIGFVLDDSLDKPDGVQQYILNLGAWFHNQGHEIHYLVGATRRTDIPNIHSLSRNVAVKFNQNRMSVPVRAHTKEIKQVLAREKFDVLHVQMPYSPLLGAKIVRAAAPTTAVIGTFHIVPFSKTERTATRLLRWWLWRSIRRFDQIICVSDPAADFARKSFKVNSVIVPNAINTSQFAAGKKLSRYDDGKINIVFLGRLVERKGCQYLLQALEILREKKQLMNVRVIVCGKGPMEAELKNYVKKHKLGSTVHFAGFVSETQKPHYLASANIAVFPSTGGESFGIVLVEAMAAGVEVVLAGDNIGYRSVMKEREDQIVDVSDTEVFAKSIYHFVTNGRARKRSRTWQQKQLRLYDVQTVGQNLIQLYREAIANRASTSDNSR